ncbi:hypothetical protein J3R30DRAFT_3751372 [Lentinula aciculospora]|uniref:FAD-binding domain-containing protein n=1 Tax=Lentinula aciculospora TaxID=153920 RepID=A0A9W9AU70_9AGAR|nr:hypothetical protein J3R30DRAFT_3751372 [Lentinula aciculospora]
MASANTNKLQVAICGAGIGGLTFALALSRFPDIDINIYEGARALTEVGAGIGIFPRPWKIIKMLGLEADLLKVTETKVVNGPVSVFQYRKSDQHEGIEFYTLVTEGSLILFHRADYQQTLLNHLPKRCQTHCSKRLRSYVQRQSGPIELLFEDGTTALCDVLVGADGLKSVVRAGVLGEKAQRSRSEGRWQEAADILKHVEPVWSGTNAYRALIPVQKLRTIAPNHRILNTPGVQYLGKQGYIIAYRISGGQLINFVAFVIQHKLENTKFNGPWMSTVEPSAFSTSFAHWEPDVQALIACVEKPMQWAIHTVRPMQSFVSGRVALLGDAAHSMTPHQGSGAGQALEDACILATVLGHPSTNRSNVAHRALRVYDNIRCPFAYKVMQVSRANGRHLTLELDEGVPVDLDSLPPKQQWDYLQRLGNTVVKNWEWAWTTSIDTSLKEALHMLESQV